MKAKDLVGPWAHEYPEVATPEPNIGFLQECLRWWDQWLKGKDTGIMDEPKLISWIQNSELPEVTYEKRPGKWVGDDSWPSKHVQGQKLWLKDQELLFEKEEADAIDDSKCAGTWILFWGILSIWSTRRSSGRSAIRKRKVCCLYFSTFRRKY